MSCLNDLAIYVFVRRTLSDQDQRIQIAHAVLKMSLVWRPAEANYKIVELDGGLSDKAFNRTVRKMPTYGVAHVIYNDSDRPEWGPTAIATVPSEQGVLPHKLRPYSPPADASSAVALDGQRGANSVVTAGVSTRTMCTAEALGQFPHACVAQTGGTEHLATNQEVAGAEPAASSRINCS